MEVSYIESTRQRMAAKTHRKRGDGCWQWTGSVSTGGYGKTYFAGRYIDAHRVAWMLDNGEIPTGGVIAHRCDNRVCIRPDHLFLTDQAGNLADMRQKSRESRGPEHAAAIRAGWTDELRARRAEQTRARMTAIREAKATAAGVPTDWKFCAACQQWKPRSGYQHNAARYDGLKSKCRPCAIREDALARKRRNLA